jgi:hypothetical protein
MTHRAKHRGSIALAAVLIVAAGTVGAAAKPPKAIPLLGSHPTRDAQTARLSLLKQRTKSVSVKPIAPGKIANSLNRRPGKTITVARKLPK